MFERLEADCKDPMLALCRCHLIPWKSPAERNSPIELHRNVKCVQPRYSTFVHIPKILFLYQCLLNYLARCINVCYFSQSAPQSIQRIYCVVLSLQLLLGLFVLFSAAAVGRINHNQAGQKLEIHKWSHTLLDSPRSKIIVHVQQRNSLNAKFPLVK